MAPVGRMADFVQHAQQLGRLRRRQPVADAAGPLLAGGRGHDLVNPLRQPPESERARYRDQFAERFLSADFLFSIYFKTT